MKVLIAGSSGLIGSALVKELIENGHHAIPLLRKPTDNAMPFWDPENNVIELAGVSGIDAVVNLSGFNIADTRWNKDTKERILDSRVKGTRLIADYFADLEDKPRVIVSASGVGAYGDCGENVVDETACFGRGFLADVTRQWEAAAASAVDAGIRVVNARLGMVLSVSGGALKKMLLPFKMGFGGVVGDGAQYISWISIHDVVKIIQYVISHPSICGPVNFVSPSPVSNHEFTKTLGRILSRPAIFWMPSFAARLVFGEMADELLLTSTRAAPTKLMDAGYQFSHPELEEALRGLLDKKA